MLKLESADKVVVAVANLLEFTNNAKQQNK